MVVPPGELEVVLTTWGLEAKELQRRTVRAVLGQETEVVFDLAGR